MSKITVSYRKKGTKWHIRFRVRSKNQQRREVIKSFSGKMAEKTIAKKASWYQIECDMDRFDPWEEKRTNSSLRVSDAITEYCNENFNSGNWSKHTKATNKSRLENTLADLTDRRLALLNKDDFQTQLANLQVKAITKKGYMSSVNAFLNWLQKSGYISEPMKVSLSVPDKIEIRNTDNIKYLTWNQITDVCGATQFYHRQIGRMYNYPEGKGADYYCDLYWFMFYSLLRKEEVPRLMNSDLLAGGKKLQVHGKGRQVDVIDLPPPAAKIARRYFDPNKPDYPLLCQHMNRPYAHFKRAIKMALGNSHPTGFHQLRHGGVVHYLTLGKPIQFISKLCRHANIQVTLEVYGDVIPDGVAQAFSDVEHRPAIEPGNLRLVKGA